LLKSRMWEIHKFGSVRDIKQLRKVVKMSTRRNKIIHEYFGVDLEILWETVANDIPQLEKKIKELEKQINR